MVRFIVLLASYPEPASCEVHHAKGIPFFDHASAGGDRLIILTTLGVADEDCVSVLVGYNKPFS